MQDGAKARSAPYSANSLNEVFENAIIRRLWPALYSEFNYCDFFPLGNLKKKLSDCSSQANFTDRAPLVGPS
jgi:hypothetical protein